MEEGAVLESMNIAATKKLPLIFLMENNGLAIYTVNLKEYQAIISMLTRRPHLAWKRQN